MRLIEADALKKAFRTNEGADVLGHSVRKLLKTDAIIDAMPTIDAVEVVRCKDCKHRDPENNHCDHVSGTMIYFPRKPDDFCSYGERRNPNDHP